MNTIMKEAFGNGKKKLIASVLGSALVLSLGTGAAYAANNDLFKVDVKAEVVESGAINNDNAVVVEFPADGGVVVLENEEGRYVTIEKTNEDGRDTTLETIEETVEVPVQK